MLLAGLVEGGDLVVKGLGHGVLPAAVAAELREGEAAVRSAVLGLAIGETGQAAEAAPVGGAEVGVVAAGESLRGQGAEEFGERACVFEPGLEIAGAGLDDGAGGESVCGEPGQG